MQYTDIDFTLEEYYELVIHHPEVILENMLLFRWGLEHLFYIENKHQQIVLLKLKEAQSRFLDTYFKLKLTAHPNAIGVQAIILKSRQQGMTTLIAAIAIFESILHGNRDSLIVAHEKGNVAKKIFKIYTRYLSYFPFPEWDTFKKRSESGDGYEFHNESVIDVTYETDVVGVTVQFLHLSEGSRFRRLDDFLGAFMPAMPDYRNSTAIIESTAQKSGDAFHSMWQQAERGNSAWIPIFYPWYIDEDNVKPFLNDTEKQTFERRLNIREDDIYGDERSLLREYEDITLEHLHKRRDLIDGLPHGLASFKREFPTTPEEAFMGVNQPVFDIKVLRDYEKTQVSDPKMFAEMRIDPEKMSEQSVKIVEVPHGIIKIWKGPNAFRPDTTFMMGSDHSEGMNDWNAALVAAQWPYEIVAEMIGYEGYNPIPRDFARQMHHLGKWYNDAWICPENNPPGNTVVDLLLEWEYPNLISEAMIFPEKTGSQRYGWRNTVETRKQALERARETIKQQAVGIPSLKLIRQLEYFCTVVIGDGTRTKDQALKKGQNKAIGANVDEYSDDLVFAFLGLEHVRVALGKPEINRRSYQDTIRDEQKQLWITETIDSVEDIFGERFREDKAPMDNWKDYS